MMTAIWRWLSKSPAYIRRFGPRHGLQLLLQIERKMPRKSASIKGYRLPGYPGPVYLRRSISDHATFWQCLVMCQYDFRRFPQFGRFITEYRKVVERGERPLIIDCGGNIGLAAVWFAINFPEAQIYSIEPDTANLDVLRRNVAPFRDRVISIHGAIWHKRTAIHIVNPESGSAAYRVSDGGSEPADPIPAYTIDAICAMATTEAPFIVKLDIEGAQGRLFKANTDWIRDTHLITLELDDWLLPWQGTSRPFFSQISQVPFDYLLGGESIFCFRDFAADSESPPQT